MTQALDTLETDAPESISLELSTLTSGWLHFASIRLDAPLFEPFNTSLYGTQIPSTDVPRLSLQVSNSLGYVELAFANISYLMAFDPDGNGPYTITTLFGFSTLYWMVGYPWCFDKDLQTAWVASPGPTLTHTAFLGYVFFGVHINYSGDPLRGSGKILDLTVDSTTGHVYVLWKGSAGQIFFDQIDNQTLTTLNTVQIPGFDPSGNFNGFIAANNGIVYLTVYDSLHPASPPDRIWRIDAGSGDGANTYAFAAGLGVPLSGLSLVDDGVPPPFRQRQRDDGLAQYNGPRVATASNPPSSKQGSIRQGQNNTYW